MFVDIEENKKYLVYFQIIVVSFLDPFFIDQRKRGLLPPLPENVLIALDQYGTGAVHHAARYPDIFYGQDGALLPHVHVGLLKQKQILDTDCTTVDQTKFVHKVRR